MIFLDLLFAALLGAIRGLLTAGKRLITIILLSSRAVQSGELIACRLTSTKIGGGSTLKRFCIFKWWHAFEGWHGNSSWGCFWNLLMCISKLICGSFRDGANRDSSGPAFHRECALSSASAVIQECFILLISGDGIMETDFPLCILKMDSLFLYVPKSVKILHSLLMRCELLVRLLEGWGEGMVSPHILCDGIEWAHRCNKYSQAVCRSTHSSTGGGGSGKL